MEIEPTDEELRAFINAMLSNLDKRVRDPEVIDEVLSTHRDMWVMLYRTGVGTDVPGAP